MSEPVEERSRLRGALSELLGHRLIRDSAVYAGSGIARNAIPFLLIPVLTRYLSPADVGIVATFDVMLAVGLVFVGLNMYGAIGVNFFRFPADEINIYVGNVVLLSFGASVIVLGAAALVFQIVPFPIPEASGRWLPVLVLAALSQALFSAALTLWQVEQRPVPYALFQVMHTALNFTLSVFFVVGLSWSWRGRILGIVIAAVTFGALSLLMIYRRGCRSLTVRADYIKDALAFGVPLVPHALGNWVLTGIDRLFLASLVGMAATGVYTIGYQIGMIVGLVGTSFNQAWSPFLFKKLESNDALARIRIVKFTYAYFVVIAAFALGVAAAAPWFLPLFVGPEFTGAYQYVFWIALGYAANGMYLMVAHYIFYTKQTHVLAGITVCSALINILLNYLLIRANGPIGAAQASTLSFVASFLLTWLAAAKVYPMPWRFWQTAEEGRVGG